MTDILKSPLSYLVNKIVVSLLPDGAAGSGLGISLLVRFQGSPMRSFFTGQFGLPHSIGGRQCLGNHSEIQHTSQLKKQKL